ncbi:MAG: phage shock protein operon transcriptional activator [Gammaproteobacteria bacterium]|nr:phage shock protein operon transcriptional activator [Gammaproteobacteria bacterium]
MQDSTQHSLIGQSINFLGVLEQVSQVAPLSKPVLIIGERGTGKEVIASRLHYLSQRWDKTLLKTNCAALPESLLESDLFGHEAGAFTGATRKHQGRFERADGGTLFLDEIASMSLRVQEKLLRVIEYGEFERVGGAEIINSDVRIIGAANVDLPQLAAEGHFREDLLDRLSFDVITLPPLRYRQDDIPLLADHFGLGMVKQLKRDFFPGFTESAREKLSRYAWPGNLRELKNVIERAVYRSEPDQLINEIIFDPFASPFRNLADPPIQTEPQSSESTESTTTYDFPMDFKAQVRAYEIQLLQAALQQHHYHQRRTAQALGLSYHQLRSQLRKYDLLPHKQEKPQAVENSV